MYTKTFDVRAMRTALSNIVERFGPEYKPVSPDPDNTATCIYGMQVDGVLTPVCLIGTLFSDLGYLGLLIKSDPTLGFAEFDGSTCSSGEALWGNLASVGIDTTEDAQWFARSAQYGQDNSLTWRQALAYADALYLHREASKAHEAIGSTNPAFTPAVGDFSDY